MYQKLIIVGNLGRDPEMRYTPDGTPVTNFSVATNRRWTDASGQQQERTVWFRVSAWRRLAETCNQYLSKGRQVMVALGQLLDRLAVGDVADEQAQLLQVGDVRGDGLEAGQEKVTDGKVGADAIGQEIVDFGSQFPGAVVYDVVGRHHFLLFAPVPGRRPGQ